MPCSLTGRLIERYVSLGSTFCVRSTATCQGLTLGRAFAGRTWAFENNEVLRGVGLTPALGACTASWVRPAGRFGGAVPLLDLLRRGRAGGGVTLSFNLAQAGNGCVCVCVGGGGPRSGGRAPTESSVRGDLSPKARQRDEQAGSNKPLAAGSRL